MSWVRGASRTSGCAQEILDGLVSILLVSLLCQSSQEMRNDLEKKTAQMLEPTDQVGILVPLSGSCGTLSKIPSQNHSSYICKTAIINLPQMVTKHLDHAGSSQMPIGRKEPVGPGHLTWNNERSSQGKVCVLEPTRSRAPPCRLGVHTCWRRQC